MVLTRKTAKNRKPQRENYPNYLEIATESSRRALGLIRLLVTGKGLYVEKRKLLIRLRAIHFATHFYAAKNVTIFNIHNNLFSRRKVDNKVLAIFNKVSGWKIVASRVASAAMLTSTTRGK